MATPSPLFPPVTGPFSIRRETPASYVVWSDGTNYHADSMRGGLDYTGANATTVIQNAIAALNGLGGGDIFFTPGTYPCQLSFIDVNNITLKGVYNQSIIQCNANSGVAVQVGNPNATDVSYHAQNIALENLVLDGGFSQGVTLGQTLRIATAFNILVNKCILQGSGEIATGAAVTTWNATQSFSKNVWFLENYCKNQKITISGVLNTWWMFNVFDGSPNVAGTRALVDFSKGDISPLTANRVTNGHFDYNAVYGWTQNGGGAQGLQSLQGCTISHNYWDGLKTLVGTVDATAPYDLNDLTVEDNYYWNCSGGMNFGYGDRIRIIKNRLMTDATPANGSTGITVLKTAAGVIPTNIEIEDNLIFKWGGLGIYPSFIRGGVKRNKIVDLNQANLNGNSLCGILLGDTAISKVDIADNEIYSTPGSGAGVSVPINYSVAIQNCRIFNNILSYANLPNNPIFFAVTIDPSMRIFGNTGYNPQGYALTSPSVPATGVDQANNTGSQVIVFISGVGSGITAYGITDPIGNLTSFTTTVNIGQTFLLDPQAKIRLTYTGSPTWKWYGL